MTTIEQSKVNIAASIHYTGLKWTMTQMANGHLDPDLNVQWTFRLVSHGQHWTFETSNVTWSQKSTLVYTLNPELMHRSIVTHVLMY